MAGTEIHKMSDARLYEAAQRFVAWLDRELTLVGRGDKERVLDVEPSGKFWLGRLAPERAVMQRNLGDRGERLEPCACGVRVRTDAADCYTFNVVVSAAAWLYSADRRWQKSERISVAVPIKLLGNEVVQFFGADAIRAALARVTGSNHFSAEVRVDRLSQDAECADWEVQVVNTSADPDRTVRDTNLYEVELRITGLDTRPFLLESLPNSFRYDRRVPCYGINCGAITDGDAITTADVPAVRRLRPRYWGADEAAPDVRFEVLARQPIEHSELLAKAMRTWGAKAWGKDSLDERGKAGSWTSEMHAEAHGAASEFAAECERVETGIRLMTENDQLRRAFVLMNRAMRLGSRHESWRHFQLGFLLANLQSIVAPEREAEIADIVWFATGGGKTETYLGMILVAAFYDRITGKTGGITAWSRFPLRMLSLQQTQRFADMMAAGERVRREENLSGDPFSLGFLVGQGATPNSIAEDPGPDSFDYDDDDAVQSFRVLLHCPFCRARDVRVVFDRLTWRLAHECGKPDCSWPEKLLPFYIVDDEIYRMLPTVVVGTLDKAAAIAMQASMRGLVGAPQGFCSQPGHGYTYAVRSKKPSGCLVPGCRGRAGALPMPPSRFGPSLRLQDELHLLKDSLGAVDSHYEALYDDLQVELGGTKPKILASSATLEGYERQVDVLYRRSARVFPVPGPSVSEGFWSTESSALMRQYSAIAPRGVTLEYTVDRLLTELQSRIRRLASDPEGITAEIGIDSDLAPALISLYGTNIVYGNTIRDLDAVGRSIETQVQVQGVVNTAALTGRTDFADVRGTLHRLENPEQEFTDRLHVITASSMMSHGVDIDRLNVMVMLGLPLTTAEFIQATARVGRTWPGLVIVVHKIARERDAGMYRCFTQFITQGDRLIEPVPITRRSRRVLERTIAGLALSRILMIHEPRAQKPLTTVSRLRDAVRSGAVDLTKDGEAIARMLALLDERDRGLRADLEDWFIQFVRNIADPPSGAQFLSDVSPSGGPMRSLRDVEEQVPVHARYT
jgi:hypothetical protein